MFGSSDLITIPYPELSPQYQSFKLNIEKQADISEALQEQYINLDRLGQNLIATEYVEDDTFADLILFTSENYFPIINLDQLMDSSNSIQLVGRFLYNLYCIDLFKELIPKAMINSGLHKCEELIVIDPVDLKGSLLSAVSNKLKPLRIISNNTPNIEISYEIYKYSFYIDVIDTDAINFINNYIQPLIIRYGDEIEDRLI